MNNDIQLCADCGEIIEDEDHMCELYENSKEEIFLQTEVHNVEELINEVFKRSPLWDSTLPYEKRGPTVTKLLWSEIDKRLNLCPGTANTKWRNLRDTYVRKLSEQRKYIPSGSGAEIKPKTVSWPYFELLGFLRPTVLRRKTFSNIKPPASSISSNKPIEQSLGKLSFNTTPTTSKGGRYTASNAVSTSDTETSLSEDIDYNKDAAVTSDYLTQQNETEVSQNISNSSDKNTAKKNLKISGQAGKKRRMNTDCKENDELLMLQKTVLSELKTTDKVINDISNDPVIAFCNYLTSQLRTLTPENFIKSQRKILSLVFELQDIE